MQAGRIRYQGSVIGNQFHMPDYIFLMHGDSVATEVSWGLAAIVVRTSGSRH
jgi:hypothetical protein